MKKILTLLLIACFSKQVNAQLCLNPAVNFSAGTSPNSIKNVDFNSDGHLDLVVANSGSNNVSILLGNGAGSFGAAANYPVGTFPYTVITADFNGDGNLDLATANSNSGHALSVL